MAETVRFGELLARHRAESQQLRAEVTAERWASQDGSAQHRRDILGGVEDYVDPRSGWIVQLPTGRSTYWVHAEYLAADDAAIDAGALVAGGWERLPPHADASSSR